MSGNKNHPTSIRAAAEVLMAALLVPNEASPPASAELIAAMDWMDQALAQPEVSRADLIERAAWAEEGIAKMKAGDAVLPIHIQAIVTAAEAGLQAHRSFGVRWAADMRAIERWRAGEPSRDIAELISASGTIAGEIKRAAELRTVPDAGLRFVAALEDVLSYSIEAAVPEARAMMLPDHADLVVWLLELLERPSSPTLDQADQMAARIGRAGMWHASQGSAHGDSLVGGEVAELIRSLASIAIAADRRAFLAEQQAIPQGLPDLIAEHLSGELGDSYDCTRAWEAWSVGTMSEDDFEPLGDRLGDLAAGLAARIAPFSILGPDPADQASLNRVAERLGLEAPSGSGRILARDQVEELAADHLEGLALLGEAAALFREYEGHHRGKARQPGEAGRIVHEQTIEKAGRNAEIAGRIERFIAPPELVPDDPAATVRTIETAADAGLIPGISSAEELRAQAEAKGKAS